MGKKFSILCNEEGKRLDVFLSKKLAITRTKAKCMLDEGHVRVNGKSPKPSLKTRKLMAIVGLIPEEEPIGLVPQPIPLDILYEDDYILAINKAKGMVVHPSFGHKEGTLVNAVLAYLAPSTLHLEPCTLHPPPRPSSLETESIRPGIVHRLDKGTTGVIIVGKDSKTQEMLSALFKERGVTKTYRAIIEGIPTRDEWTVEGHIGRHPTDRKRMAVLKKGGRDALTSFKVLKRLRGFTYLEAYPRTGRTHQIRVHLQHSGHPVVGDDLYGKKSKHLTGRPLLHAYRIEFPHPATGKPLTIEAPVPADMEEFIDRIQ
jgi:23S rRNA pseudouridine1911/1915/1917 synthase